MADSSPLISNLNSGEFSPRMEARLDFEKYPNAAKTMRNVLPYPQGGFTRRPGTRFARSVKTAGDATILIPFEFSEDDAYIIEHGDAYMRFFKRQARLATANVASSITNGTFASDITSWNDRSTGSINSTVTMTIANPCVVTYTGHGLSNNDPIIFTTSGADLPTGITAGTTYYILNSTTDTFNIAATPLGATITTTGSQSGTHSVTRKPTFGWDGAYEVPDDFLRVVSVHPSDSDNASISYRLEHLSLPGGVKRVIQVKMDTRLYLRYVADLQDYNLMSATFRNALSWRLARDFAMTIGGRPQNFFDFVDKNYRSELSKAKAVDGVEDWPEPLGIGSWTSARAGSRSAFTNDG